MERLSNSAYDCNIAMRFNRMDVATGYVAKTAQTDFAERHAKWGRALRIVDVELNGMRMITSDVAEVNSGVSWHRANESVIRFSRVSQRWKESGNGWKLEEEMRVAGSPGLFERARSTDGQGGDVELRPPRIDMGQL